MHLDTEAPKVPPDYEALLEEFAKASGGAFAPNRIEQPVTDRGGDTIHVRFNHGAHVYSFDARNQGDWYDVAAALIAIHRAIAESGAIERFVELAPDCQCKRYVFARESWFRDVAAWLHLPLPSSPDTAEIQIDSGNSAGQAISGIGTRPRGP